MFEQIRIPYTYTIESSIGLYYDFAEKTVTEFQEKAYAKMGNDIGCGLAQFIVIEEEYESMMKERQLARQKVRDSKGNK